MMVANGLAQFQAKESTDIPTNVYDKIILEIKTPKIKKKINLNYSLKTGVLVPPKYWCSIRFVTKNAILMVACDLNYNSNDYLSNFDKYKKYLKK